MNESTLRERLSELHAQLERGPELDDQTRALLVAVLEDIRALQERTELAKPAEHHSLAEQLREATWELEETHPKLTTAAAQLIEALTSPFQ